MHRIYFYGAGIPAYIWSYVPTLPARLLRERLKKLSTRLSPRDALSESTSGPNPAQTRSPSTSSVAFSKLSAWEKTPSKKLTLIWRRRGWDSRKEPSWKVSPWTSRSLIPRPPRRKAKRLLDVCSEVRWSQGQSGLREEERGAPCTQLRKGNGTLSVERIHGGLGKGEQNDSHPCRRFSLRWWSAYVETSLSRERKSRFRRFGPHGEDGRESEGNLLRCWISCRNEKRKSKSLLRRARNRTVRTYSKVNNKTLFVTRISHVVFFRRVFFYGAPKQPQKPIRVINIYSIATNICKTKTIKRFCWFNKCLNKIDMK